MEQKPISEASKNLNSAALIASLIIGPALTITFWMVLNTEASYPYRDWDQRNGWGELAATVISAVLTMSIILTLMRKQRSWIIHYGSAALWLLTALFLGWSAWDDLVVAERHRCLDPDCAYELTVVSWWVLAIIHWVSLLVFRVIDKVQRQRTGN